MKKLKISQFWFHGLIWEAFILWILFSLTGASFSAQNSASDALKKQDIERAKKYEFYPKTETSGKYSTLPPAGLPKDSDDDGMPDSWEKAHGLDPKNPDDAWFDPDGDNIVNLFEFQLGSDCKNVASPPVVTAGPTNADYTSLATAIDQCAPGSVIRVARGTYRVNYVTFDVKIVMIQGGWSADFKTRDLLKYPTTLDGNNKKEILYFSILTGNPVVILDGLEFKRGKGYFGAVNLLAQGSAFMRTSIFNCIFTQCGNKSDYGGVLTMNNWETSLSDRTIANTVIAGNSATGVYGQIIKSGNARWRIIHSALSNNRKGGSDNGFGIEAFTLDKGILRGHIFNSIIWGNQNLDLKIFKKVTFSIDHSDFSKFSTAGGAQLLEGDVCLDVDPGFVNPSKYDFHLKKTSLLKNRGIKKGIPLIDFEGDKRVIGPAPDIGSDECK